MHRGISFPRGFNLCNRLMGGDFGVIAACEESTQLAPHPVTCGPLHARNERQRDDCADDGGSSGHICADTACRLALFEIPDDGFVAGFLLPPAKADAPRRARFRSAREASTPVVLLRAHVQADDLTHS